MADTVPLCHYVQTGSGAHTSSTRRHRLRLRRRPVNKLTSICNAWSPRSIVSSQIHAVLGTGTASSHSLRLRYLVCNASETEMWLQRVGRSFCLRFEGRSVRRTEVFVVGVERSGNGAFLKMEETDPSETLVYVCVYQAIQHHILDNPGLNLLATDFFFKF